MPIFGTRNMHWLGGLSLGLALALAPAASQAVTISASDLTPGASSVDLGFATVTASPTFFASKTVAGFEVAGVQGGFEGGEIDLAEESITVVYDEAQIVTDLTVGLLFIAGEEDDSFDEEAKVIAWSDGVAFEYLLSTVDATTAVWSGGATVSNLSPATFGNAAVWSVENPFGDLAVDRIELVAVGPDTPEDFRNNDYGLVSLSSRVVPEPGTLALLGSGLVGLAIAGRRRS